MVFLSEKQIKSILSDDIYMNNTRNNQGELIMLQFN